MSQPHDKVYRVWKHLNMIKIRNKNNPHFREMNEVNASLELLEEIMSMKKIVPNVC